MYSSLVRVITESEAVPSEPKDGYILKTGFEPDRFQKFAIEAIEAGHNVLVTAKTGSGKTFVGEYQIAKSLSRGGRIFYTTPIKSLSNQKFHDLKKLFPDVSVGIMTGDIKFCPDAQILVMTTEILRNLLFKQGTATEKVGVTSLLSLEGLDSVIFDEVHYINDPDRGHVWEETLMLLPASIKIILLSATLTKPQIFANWLAEVKGVPLTLVSTQWRAVPLYHHIVDLEGKLRIIQDNKEVFYADVYREYLASLRSQRLAIDKYKDTVHNARKSGVEGAIGGKVHKKSFEHQLNDLLNSLSLAGNLPAIIFQFSRVGCERLADCVRDTFLSQEQSVAVKHIWDFHLSRYKGSLETSKQYHSLLALVQKGIAYHHSGLQPFLKEILEILFNKGLIKVLCAQYLPCFRKQHAEQESKEMFESDTSTFQSQHDSPPPPASPKTTNNSFQQAPSLNPPIGLFVLKRSHSGTKSVSKMSQLDLVTCSLPHTALEVLSAANKSQVHGHPSHDGRHGRPSEYTLPSSALAYPPPHTSLEP